MPIFQFEYEGKLETIEADGWHAEPQGSENVVFTRGGGEKKQEVARYRIAMPRANIKTLGT